MSEASPPASTPRRRVRVKVRPARLGDVRPLATLYMAQTEEQRHGYHPFPFSRPRVVLTYFALVTGQSLLGWAMRRSTRLLALLFVAQVEGGTELAGSGTLRGVLRPGGQRFVRFGFFVAGSYQGMGVGKTLLWGLAEAGLALGYHRGLGSVFQSASNAIPAIAAAGFNFAPTGYRDPKAPGEVNFETQADLEEMVRRGRQREAIPP